MINKVVLIGRVGRDPETRSLEGGSMVGRFPMATSESYKDKSGQWIEQTEWHNIVVWRELAQRVGQQLRKGMLVYVEGKITYRSWRESDGRERYTTEIVASAVRMLSRPELGNQPQGEQPQQYAQPQYHQPQQPAQNPALQQPFYQPPKFNQAQNKPATNNNSTTPKTTTSSKKTTTNTPPPVVQPLPKQQQPPPVANTPTTSKQRQPKQPKEDKEEKLPPFVPTALPPAISSSYVDDFPIIDIDDDYAPLTRMTPEEEAALRRRISQQQFNATINDLDEALKDEMPLERLSDLLLRDDEPQI